MLILPLMALLTGLLNANTLTINGINGTYFINSSGNIVYFSQSAANNIVICKGNSVISSVYFSNLSFNNTIANCTVSGNITSGEDAHNNLVNVSGSYKLDFLDNTSSVGIGNYFHLLVYQQDHTYGVGRFIEFLPLNLANNFPMLIAMYTKFSSVKSAADSINYTLPEFGIQLNASVNGSAFFPIEARAVWKNRQISYNPWLFETPYIGYDEVSYTHFNASNFTTFSPTYILPQFYFHEIFPANKPIYFNYTIVFHQPHTYAFANLMNGWQTDPNISVAHTYYNITNGTLSYFQGNMPGIYTHILLLNTNREHENSTSSIISIGLGYCTNTWYTINEGGYYPFVYKTLRNIWVFWLNNTPCSIGAYISASNVTVDCKGGEVSATNSSFYVGQYINNITIENCRVFGNGTRVFHSNVTFVNDTFISTAPNNFAINAVGSEIKLNNVKFYNYSNALVLNNTIIKNITNVIINATKGITTKIVPAEFNMTDAYYNVSVLRPFEYVRVVLLRMELIKRCILGYLHNVI